MLWVPGPSRSPLDLATARFPVHGEKGYEVRWPDCTMTQAATLANSLSFCFIASSARLHVCLLRLLLGYLGQQPVACDGRLEVVEH